MYLSSTLKSNAVAEWDNFWRLHANFSTDWSGKASYR